MPPHSRRTGGAGLRGGHRGAPGGGARRGRPLAGAPRPLRRGGVRHPPRAGLDPAGAGGGPLRARGGRTARGLHLPAPLAARRHHDQLRPPGRQRRPPRGPVRRLPAPGHGEPPLAAGRPGPRQRPHHRRHRPAHPRALRGGGRRRLGAGTGRHALPATGLGSPRRQPVRRLPDPLGGLPRPLRRRGDHLLRRLPGRAAARLEALLRRRHGAARRPRRARRRGRGTHAALHPRDPGRSGPARPVVRPGDDPAQVRRPAGAQRGAHRAGHPCCRTTGGRRAGQEPRLALRLAGPG